MLFFGTASAADQPFAKVAPGTSGIIGDRAALFLPAGMTPGKLPQSLCLIKPPRIRNALPENWTLRPEFSRDATHTRMTLRVPDGTSLYGTGEVTGPLLRNGKTVTLWNTDNFLYKIDDGKRLYQSHPWVLGVRPDGTAFGVLADSTWRAEMNLANGIEFTSEGPLFPVIIIDRASPREALRGLAEWTGTLPLPPKWALGYQQSRWSYHPDTRVREIADGFRSRKIPCDVIWMDIHYMDGYRVFTFDPREFPDPKGLNHYLHESGFHSVWMIDAGVKTDPAYGVYDSGCKNDVWVKTAAGTEYNGKVWPGKCAFPDFTRPETRAWWAGLYKNFMALGIDGVWNDMDEPSVFDVPDGTMPRDNSHRGGGGLAPGPHLQYHNVYGMLMVQATREGIMAANPDKRPFVLTRSNFLGGQRYAATWTGDNESRWEHLRMSIPMVLNFGLSGQPFSGPDIGGYAGIPTPELWANWIAVGAFYPFCRGHSDKDSPDKEPWAFGPGVEQTARIALERRYRLLPYIYTKFYETSHDGIPVMQPVFFAEPKNPALRSEEQAFLLGGDLLVVPKWAKEPQLPGGIWRTVSLVAGDVEAGSVQPELKIRGGAIVPLGKAVQHTGEESLDPLTLLVCPDAHGRAEGRLYEDSGEGYGCQRGDFLLTGYRAETRGNAVVVKLTGLEGRRKRPVRKVNIEVVTEKGVFRATVDESREMVVPLQGVGAPPAMHFGRNDAIIIPVDQGRRA